MDQNLIKPINVLSKFVINVEGLTIGLMNVRQNHPGHQGSGMESFGDCHEVISNISNNNQDDEKTERRRFDWRS